MERNEIISHMRQIVGDPYVIVDQKELQEWGSSWTKDYEVDPLLVVLPKTTQEVSHIMAFCYEHSIAVVPCGGHTGLSGGAIAKNKEVILSLKRMNRILETSTVGLHMEVEAGVITQDAQENALAHDLYFPLDLAAKGSSQLGGNIATNAGGLKFIAYGGMREQVLGLEVVLANGNVLDLNSSLRKNNCGYDLKHLFIGSEGTLGVITKATLKLRTKPRRHQVACLGFSCTKDVINFLSFSHQQAIQLTAFEFFMQNALEKVLTIFSQTKPVFEKKYPVYALIEAEISHQHDLLEAFLEKAFEKGLIEDALLSSSSQEFHYIWGLRENISESLAAYGWVKKNDLSVSVSALGDFLFALERLIQTTASAVEVVLFGHVGDGNIHVNYVAPKKMDKQLFLAEAMVLERKIFKLLADYQGSISAEHGIGLLKKRDLALTCSAEEIAYMREIKKLFDPKCLLNPGKILDT